MTPRLSGCAAAALGAGALVTLLASSAFAAVQTPCVRARVVPRVASVPANLPAFGYAVTQPTPMDIQLVKKSGTAPGPVTVTLGGAPVDGYTKVNLSSALEVGASYEMTIGGQCSYAATPDPGPFTFTVAAAAPLPTALATLSGTPTASTKDFGTTQFTIDATFKLDASMTPWASVYELLAVVDGKLVATKSTIASGDAKITATGWCDGSAPSSHTLALRARLPFTATLETAPASLTFDCPPPRVNGPTGTPINPSIPAVDGGGASSSTSSSGATPTNTSSSGGTFTCAAAPHERQSSRLALGMLLLGAVALRRRRA